MSRFRVSVRQLPDEVTALDLFGFIDRHTVHSLDETLTRLLRQGRSKLIVGCSDLGYLSTAGISVFMAQLIQIHQSGGDLKFFGMNRNVRMQMDAAGFSKVLDIYDTEAEARARFREVEAARQQDDAFADDGFHAEAEHAGDQIAILRIRGDIDRHTVDALERAIATEIEAGRPKLVLSCAGIRMLSSVGMGIFIQYLQPARSGGGDLRFCCMPDGALSGFTMLGLQNFFRLFETEEEAVESYYNG